MCSSDLAVAAVFPVKSELAEDEVMAAIVPREGAALDPVELVRFCEPRMAYFAVPRYLEFMAVLPSTENGKVQKFKLRERGITGTINYVEGIIDLEHITLPALGQEYVAQYQYGEPVTERHIEPGRLSTPGQVGHLSITLDGAGGGATNLTPGSVHVKFNALYHKFDVDDQQLVIETRDPIITLRDDGQGQLIDASGNVLGAINYSAGTLHFMPDGSAPLPKPTYAWVTVGTRWEGNNQIAVQRWTMTGIEYHNTAYTFPDGEGGWVEVTYRNNNSALAQNATLTAQALRIDVTPGFSEAILE